MGNCLLLKATIKGLLSYIPGVTKVLTRSKTKSNHSNSNPEFCYSLWLSMLVFLKENRIDFKARNIGEVGSGGSIGVGICALLSGCEKYYSLETEEIFDVDQNLKILDEIIVLFRNKTRIPDKFDQLNIKINNYDFPEDLIEPLYLQDKIISDIRNDITERFKNSRKIGIIANWESQPSLNLDFIFSRAVMEHVSIPEQVYRKIYFHLSQGSFMLHDIELHSHGLSKRIDGHIKIPEKLWKIIYGRRKYFLNRWEKKDHERSIIDNNFKIIKTQEVYKNNSISKEKILYGEVILARKMNG